MSAIFISYSHSDQAYINDLKSVRLNRNHGLNFNDNSLSEPIYNGQGHVNRRPPSDPMSQPVRDEIKKLLHKSNKLLVILGNDTHSKLWVEWEIKEFNQMHWNPEMLLMNTPNAFGGAPTIANNQKIHGWDLDLISKWVRS